MITIKMTLYDIFNGIQKWINDSLNTDLDLFDTNYSELYIYPKKVDLYIKEKKGKKVSYRKIDHFFTTEPYMSELHIELSDGVTIKDKLELDWNLAIEQDLHNYRVYNSDDTPLNGSKEYIDCSTRDQAIQLSKLLNRIDKGSKWVWA